ncbi:hypothetical protein ACX1HF_00005, partial [Yersinia pseudotuberculosis]
KFLFVHNLPVSVVGVKISKTGNYTILFTVSIFTTELRTRWQPDFPDWAGYGHQITVAAFFDQGWGAYYRQPIVGLSENNINISGFGSYITFARPADYFLNLTWAHRTGQAVTRHQDNDQLWLSAYKMF